ncbi:acid protease [Apiospora phragmitis]|uniref:Acid protease n=1 Tax=Apiospora phragmitis TaxID=2905665 RepID=A0ABR1W1C9_9PEZI
MLFLDFRMNYDDGLGLSPRWDAPATLLLSYPSPFALDQDGTVGRTDENIFAEVGPKMDDDRIWAVVVQSMRWDNRTHPIHHRFNSSTIAVFSTSWYIGLPDSLAGEVHRSLPVWAGKQCTWGILCTINCAARRYLPDLVFELAGREFAVTPSQYAYPLVTQGEEQCTFNILRTATFTEEGYTIPSDTVVLGTPFLNAYYSVYDLDNMEVRHSLSLSPNAGFQS